MGIYQAILLGNVELINFFEQNLIEEEEAIKNRKSKTRKLLETWKNEFSNFGFIFRCFFFVLDFFKKMAWVIENHQDLLQQN